MSDIAIKIDKLGKVYRIGAKRKAHDTLRDAVTDFFFSRFRRLTGKSLLDGDDDTIWAIKDVSLEVNRGEVLGVIGRNGAGKSTLLKILSRITEPTEGRVELRGRVGSLLEVGTGFHPELTGRENIFLNGAIMGMSRAEIKNKFDEIVAFSEIEKFIDTPVKRYSSGMFVRLAFAVAAHLDPEILLVDEVLAVGDMAFQKKCLGKMGDITKEGRTVLFVSHNMSAITSLCERCILLQEGKVAIDGSSNEVTNEYFASMGHEGKNIMDTSNLPRPTNAGKKLRVLEVRIISGFESAKIPLGEPLLVEMRIEVEESVENISVGMGIFSAEGIKLKGSSSGIDRGLYPKLEPGTYIVKATMDPLGLVPGKYILDMDVRSERERLDFLERFFPFDVTETRMYDTQWYKTREGYFVTKYDWELESI